MPHRRLGNFLRYARPLPPAVVLLLILWTGVCLYEWDPKRGDHLHIEREMIAVGLLTTCSIVAALIWLRDQLVRHIDEQTDILREALEVNREAIMYMRRGPRVISHPKDEGEGGTPG